MPSYLQSLQNDWGMYLIATIPLGGVVVGIGSAGYLLTSNEDDEITQNTRTDAFRLMIYSLITTILWVIIVNMA